MSMLDPVDALAAEIAGEPGSQLRLRQAVVMAIGATYTIQLAGSTVSIAGVRALRNTMVVVGQTVQVLQNGPDLLILGDANSSQNDFAGGLGCAGVGGVTYVAGTGNVVAGTTFSVTKKYLNSRLEVDLRGSAYASSGTPSFVYGLQFNAAVNYQIGGSFFNTPADHRNFSAINWIASGAVAPGVHSVTAYLVPAGANVQTDNNDWWSCKVTEIAP